MVLEDIVKSGDFENAVNESKRHLMVVHFWAPWSPQCTQMNTVLTELAAYSRFATIHFTKVEAESLPEISQKYEIVAVPTFVFIKNCKVVDRLDGANAPELTKKVEKHASVAPQPPAPAPAPAPPTQDLTERLKALISQAPVMVFIKGVPEQPRCGFSKTLVAILAEKNIKFSSFDILEDEEVRQGLKKYSDWPTYPQVYVKGELIGGLDIVKEMVESGELMDVMPKQQPLEDRLKSLINQSDVVLFMKGDKDVPRCGFSKQTISILQNTQVPFTTFDILTDEEVRQGLKKYSDWPTYPQLYAKGELIGGLDIIKELEESGELESALKGS